MQLYAIVYLGRPSRAVLITGPFVGTNRTRASGPVHEPGSDKRLCPLPFISVLFAACTASSRLLHASASWPSSSAFSEHGAKTRLIGSWVHTVTGAEQTGCPVHVRCTTEDGVLEGQCQCTARELLIYTPLHIDDNASRFASVQSLSAKLSAHACSRLACGLGRRICCEFLAQQWHRLLGD